MERDNRRPEGSLNDATQTICELETRVWNQPATLRSTSLEMRDTLEIG
jgi:hypothetical protein